MNEEVNQIFELKGWTNDEQISDFGTEFHFAPKNTTCHNTLLKNELRPEKTITKNLQAASLKATTMRWSGIAQRKSWQFQSTLLSVVYDELVVDSQLLFSSYKIQPQPIRTRTECYGNSSSLSHRRRQ